MLPENHHRGISQLGVIIAVLIVVILTALSIFAFTQGYFRSDKNQTSQSTAESNNLTPTKPPSSTTDKVKVELTSQFEDNKTNPVLCNAETVQIVKEAADKNNNAILNFDKCIEETSVYTEKCSGNCKLTSDIDHQKCQDSKDKEDCTKEANNTYGQCVKSCEAVKNADKKQLTEVCTEQLRLSNDNLLLVVNQYCK